MPQNLTKKTIKMPQKIAKKAQKPISPKKIFLNLNDF